MSPGWPAKVRQEIDQWPTRRRPTHHIQVTILEDLAVNQEMQNDAEEWLNMVKYGIIW